MNQRTRRSPARFLGPLALIAVIVALLAIISGNGNSGGGNSSNDASITAPAATTTKKKSSSKSKHKTATVKQTGPRTYTVQVGDTLGGIAAKTGVSLSKLQELNPNVDPHTMNAGQQIRLR